MITTIILNGPAGSGKDTIANMIAEQCNATKQEFKHSLYMETAKHYSVDLKAFTDLATDRIEKESFKNWFGTKFAITPRNALIHVSEDIIKPLHGLSYFGELSAELLTEGLNVFSDGGFVSELEPISKKSEKVILCRLYREGFDFSGDSRKYIPKNKIPKSALLKTNIYNIYLEENKPQEAVDYIKRLIKL